MPTTWFAKTLVLAGTGLLVLACSTTAPLTTGSLEITVAGPPGAPAVVTVSGPSGYGRTLSTTTTLTGLAPGAYTITATNVVISNATYGATPSPVVVAVAVSAVPATAQVSYSLISGILDVTASGLPSGAVGGVSIIGPGGINQTGNTPNVFYLLAGTYTVSAATVSDGGALYAGAPSPQTIVVPASPTPVNASFAYYLLPLTITPVQLTSGTVGVVYGSFTQEAQRCVLTPVYGWHVVCEPCTQTSCIGLKGCGRGMVPGVPCVREKGTFEGVTLSATAGTAPYNWSSSTMPPGLSLLSNGEILGTPTTAGTYTVTVRVTDSATPPKSATADLSMVIAP